MWRKRIKSNKYHLKSVLTRSILLEEDDLKFSCLNSDFGESNRLTEDQRGYRQNQKLKQKIQLEKGKNDHTRHLLPLDVANTSRPRICSQSCGSAAIW